MSSEYIDSAEFRQDIKLLFNELVNEADKMYVHLKRKYDNDTKIDTIVISVLVWIVAFLIFATSSFTLFKMALFSNPTLFFIIITVLAIFSGILTYIIKRRKGFQFAKLGELVNEIKEGNVSLENGLKLVDAIYQAKLTVKSERIDSAFINGIIAFMLVGFLGGNLAVGLLAGVIVYLYFRYEAIKDYEKEEVRYEKWKNRLLQNL